MASGGGVSSGGVGPPRPVRSPQGCDSGERVTYHEDTPPPDDRTWPPRAPHVDEQSGLELDLDPGAAAETAAQAGEHVGEPHLPAVFRSERGVSVVDGARLCEEARAGFAPLAADAPTRIRRRDSRTW